MVKLKNLQKHYPDFSLNCSLEVNPGMITGFIGPNGAGKSTTFKAMLGLISHDSGDMELFGKSCNTPSIADKERMGVVLSESTFNGELTVTDVNRVLSAFYPLHDQHFFMEKASLLKLPVKQAIKTFSTGMRAKLKVLSAISHHADLLILDEPTTGLDTIARDQILDLLREYMEENENCSILISSHISRDLEQLCDDFYMIDAGEVFFHEETDRLFSDYAVIKVDSHDYGSLDLGHIIRRKQEPFGWSLLTDQRQFYIDNCPGLAIEKITLDELITIMLKGEAL